MSNIVYGHGDGFLTQGERRGFPISFYELPAEDDSTRIRIPTWVLKLLNWMP